MLILISILIIILLFPTIKSITTRPKHLKMVTAFFYLLVNLFWIIYLLSYHFKGNIYLGTHCVSVFLFYMGDGSRSTLDWGLKKRSWKPNEGNKSFPNPLYFLPSGWMTRSNYYGMSSFIRQQELGAEAVPQMSPRNLMKGLETKPSC